MAKTGVFPRLPPMAAEGDLALASGFGGGTATAAISSPCTQLRNPDGADACGEPVRQIDTHFRMFSICHP